MTGNPCKVKSQDTLTGIVLKCYDSQILCMSWTNHCMETYDISKWNDFSYSSINKALFINKHSLHLFSIIDD